MKTWIVCMPQLIPKQMFLGVSYPREDLRLSLGISRLAISSIQKKGKQDDPVTAISRLHYIFIENSERHFSVDSYVYIDETHIAFSGRCHFQVYLPKKIYINNYGY